MNPYFLVAGGAILLWLIGRKTEEPVVDTSGAGMEISFGDEIDPRLLASATADKLGIDNEPETAQQRANLVWLTDKIREMESLTADIVSPWPITSGYRNTVLNAAVGGESMSRHLSGLAVDVGLSDPQKAMLYEAVVALKDPSLQQAIIYEWQNSLHFGFFGPGETTKAPSLLASYTKGSYEVYNG